MIKSVPHSEYDNFNTLNEVFNRLKDIGFEDVSYGNDTCPSIGIVLNNSQFITVYVDYHNLELREYPEWNMFNVVWDNQELSEYNYQETDSIEEAIEQAQNYVTTAEIFLEKTLTSVQ